MAVIVWVLVIIGQVHGGASVATREFTDEKLCRAVAGDLGRWPQVQSTKCFEVEEGAKS